jgi:hypothetical protein
MKNKLFLMFALFFISLSFVSAVPRPTYIAPNNELNIIFPSYDTYKEGMDYDFYWHVSNSSTLLTNKTASCVFHMYEQNKLGEHTVIDNNPKYVDGRDFEVEVEGANFTIGSHCRLIECNTSNQVGEIESCFEVTKTGEDINSQQSLIMIAIILCCLFGMFFTLMLSQKFMEYENLRPLSIILVFLSGILFIFLIFI